ncbi:MAG: hypothetical protein JF597_00940 [Streptomyces sp.]|uniref:hypothetical protein n=1 Tax=Streptomyces sp. TaxID=1931 RepID=UPI0025CFBE8E|nr:hypothetical protein [Streptomyces sp.]MBW8792204.1 hypothetical protein [Streptomyces sp.]
MDPSSFTADVTNPWFPLEPGTTYVFSGTKDGKQAMDVFAPSRRTVTIDGVLTRAVNDRGFLDGVLEEQTTDYYAQDSCGNVWYFGEDTATLDEHGHVESTEGSFRAGVGGAEPGVYIEANPQIGAVFRQEWSPGQAEDRYRALSTTGGRTVRYGSFTATLRTEEKSDLEPEVTDNKYYARGVGQIEELAVTGDTERLELVAVLK